MGGRNVYIYIYRVCTSSIDHPPSALFDFTCCTCVIVEGEGGPSLDYTITDKYPSCDMPGNDKARFYHVQ